VSPLLAHTLHGLADAPALVLLHPIATHGEIWAPQRPVWSLRRRVVCVDLAGHGASAPAGEAMDLAGHAAAVVRLLDALGIERAAVVGLSFGGMVAQALAVHHAARVSALVLAHTSAQTPPAVREIWEQRLTQFEREGLAAQVQPTLQRWFTPAFVQAAPATLHWVAQQILRTSPAGYAHAVRAIQQLDHLDALATIEQPVLVLAGQLDTALPPGIAAGMAERLPRAELVVLESAAHLGNVEQPVAFTESVLRFLDRCGG